VTSVAEIIRYRVEQEVLVRKTAENRIETPSGVFRVFVFQDDVDNKEHLVLLRGQTGEFDSETGPLLRIHSECLTGDVFGSRRCDCGQQLENATHMIAAEGQGLILYLRQEGRGIGLGNKLRAYELQDKGADTVEANLSLGFAPDERDYAVAAKILNFFGVSRVRLLTNNPHKIERLRHFGIAVTERIPLVAAPDDFSNAYLETKKSKLGHWL